MNPSVQPGTSGWIYCDNNINPQLVDSLAKRWPATENMYSVTFKGVFRQLREERDAVCHYVYHRRYVSLFICFYLSIHFLGRSLRSIWKDLIINKSLLVIGNIHTIKYLIIYVVKMWWKLNFIIELMYVYTLYTLIHDVTINRMM